MKIIEQLSDKFRSLSDYRQPVYDPNYTGMSPSKWILIGIGILILAVIFYTIGSNTPHDATSVSSSNVEEGLNDVNKIVAEQPPVTYTVSRVIDGDTIEISANGETRRVRLIGVDTPEKNHPSKPVECFANEASDHMATLVAGKSVTVEEDSSQDEKDKYNRYLYYVYVDSQNINKQMIEDGYAYEYTYTTPYKYQGDFKAAQSTASTEDRGLWSPSTCNGERTIPSSAKPASSATPTQAPTPAPSTQSAASNCDPNYTPCVPNVSYDLDCGDIGFSVQVTGTDHHRFDREGDGYGCESY